MGSCLNKTVEIGILSFLARICIRAIPQHVFTSSCAGVCCIAVVVACSDVLCVMGCLMLADATTLY